MFKLIILFVKNSKFINLVFFEKKHFSRVKYIHLFRIYNKYFDEVNTY